MERKPSSHRIRIARQMRAEEKKVYFQPVSPKNFSHTSEEVRYRKMVPEMPKMLVLTQVSS